ncbi:hypothetical protein AJ78_02023 [Emergomyces pasteurianus Ep9510]|uniref:Gag1-like clamp domain-containing protein n=1 Tax=Emergomyces pasteurianus Ep9510 TaxID=1447872 RepID=A0A1J9PP34_9EURO|nr:hypothetical protein AJ78_02023 [Emergomyces pasteurianus Ep9510]
MDLTQPDGSPSQPPHASSVFASLHRKPRPAPSGGTHGTAESRETREEAIKSAKRYLLETIRDDWTYEHRPTSPGSEPKKVQPQSSTLCGPSDGAIRVCAREVREWREREQDSSCSETDVRTGGIGSGEPSLLAATSIASDPYRFESPDAVEESILERKRKRRKVVRQELAWNEGLRIWMERREAWTGARLPSSAASSQGGGVITCQSAGSSEGSGAGSRIYEESGEVEMVSPDSTGPGDAPSRPLSSSSAKAPQIANAPRAPPGNSSGDMDIQEALSHISVDDNNYYADAKQPHFLDSEEPLIPVVEPLLPITNPIRASIKPSIYPSIYSKVVIQSLTPAIPINLSDVTKALVQGWKADGEWPPKPTVTQNVPVVKKKRPGNNPPTDDAGKSRRLSGSSVTEAMKKVFSLSGIHSGRRFHIRGGSHGGAGAGSPTASGAAPNEVAEAH